MSNDITTLRSALLPSSFAEVLQFAEIVKDTDFISKDFKGKPGAIVAAVTYGAELGMTPMQAINSIGVINGHPFVYGDGLLGLCMGHPQWGGMDEKLTGAGDAMVATCTVRRIGGQVVTRSFSMEDAKRANLAKKAGPWTEYPQRMCPMRARSWALRDSFADVLKGIRDQHEAADIPRDVTPPKQAQANAETRRRAMQEVEAIEVVTIYGDVQHLLPIDLDGWLKEQAGLANSEAALVEWQENNPGLVDDVVAVELARRRADAKPNGSGASAEVKKLYRGARAALEAGDFERAVKAKVEAFGLTQDETVRAGFDKLFETHDQPELV